MSQKFVLNNQEHNNALITNLQALRPESGDSLKADGELGEVCVTCLDEVTRMSYDEDDYDRVINFQTALQAVAPGPAEKLGLKIDGDFGNITNGVILDLISEIE